MDAKATTEANMICDYLMSEFHCHVSVLIGDAVRFRIEADPSHWIYIPQEFFADTEAATIIEMIEAGDLIDELENSDSPQYRAIERTGIRAVDAAYAKIG